MPVELTKELILKGRNFTKKITLPSYNAELTIKPLTDLELSEIIRKAGESGIPIMNLLTGTGVSEDVALTAIPVLIEIAAYGSIVYDRSGDQPVELSLDEKRELFKQMYGMTTVFIASEILTLTVKPLETLEDFQKARKGKD